LQAKAIDLEQLWTASPKVGAQQKVFVAKMLNVDDRDVLSNLVDQLKVRKDFGAAVLIGQPSEGTSGHPILVAVAEEWSKAKPAGQLLKEVAAVTGGRGGGRPTFAQGAVERVDKLSEAFEKASAWLGA
jgi:alanyl-tRNA synthetase